MDLKKSMNMNEYLEYLFCQKHWPNFIFFQNIKNSESRILLFLNCKKIYEINNDLQFLLCSIDIKVYYNYYPPKTMSIRQKLIEYD